MKKTTLTFLGQLIYVTTALMALALIPSHALADSFLWNAISSNDIGRAKTLIALGANVNQKNSIGYPILHHAVSQGNPELVELLISKGADVNAKDRFDRVALHFAFKKGMAKILVAHGAIVDAPDDHGETPLHHAAKGYAGVPKEALLEFADVLISHGADVNRSTGKGKGNMTPLNVAAELNNLPAAKLLIKRGADVEGGGSSPLTSAGANGDYVEMAQLLVENGAGVNTRSTAGGYPLHRAAGRGNIKVTKYLLAHGANPNAADGKGFTALYSAAGSDCGVSTAAALLSKGADPNVKNVYGQTALHQAASQGVPKIVELLLANKADVNSISSEGFTPLHAAACNGKNDTRKTVVEILLKSGANVNAKIPRSGETPLHKAIFRGDVEVVKLLLDHGADVNATSKFGVTSLYFARNSKVISELLKEHGAK